VANDKTAHYIVKSLEIIPPRIKRLVDETGMQIYCFNEKFKPSTIGLLSSSAEFFDDGRSANEASAFYADGNVVCLFDKDVFFSEQNSEKAFSTVLHEYGHAVDYALALKNKSKYWYNSSDDESIFAGWKKHLALDEYAETNPAEYFAQAFMAYFNDLTGYKPWSYREHTRTELIQRDRNMFDYIKGLTNL
jgi:hypothetical protein